MLSGGMCVAQSVRGRPHRRGGKGREAKLAMLKKMLRHQLVIEYFFLSFLYFTLGCPND